MRDKVASVERIRHEVRKPAPYTPRTTSGDIDTRHSATPRTINGVDAAFKDPSYGDWWEYHKGPFRHTWLIWLGTAVILLAVAAMLVYKGG
jgi:hypothetical protein